MTDISPPTAFEKAVIDILKAAEPHSVDGYRLREALMDKGMGKHPAGVAMNLTRVAWKERYFTCYTDDQQCRNFLLTSDGRAWEGCRKWRWDGQPGDTCVCGIDKDNHP